MSSSSSGRGWARAVGLLHDNYSQFENENDEEKIKRTGSPCRGHRCHHWAEVEGQMEGSCAIMIILDLNNNLFWYEDSHISVRDICYRQMHDQIPKFEKKSKKSVQKGPRFGPKRSKGSKGVQGPVQRVQGPGPEIRRSQAPKFSLPFKSSLDEIAARRCSSGKINSRCLLTTRVTPFLPGRWKQRWTRSKT